MAEAESAMLAEPLVAQHSQAFQLLYETTPGFAKSWKAADYPRLHHRGGGLLAQAVCNPELLVLLKLPVGATAGAVRAALNKPDKHGNLPVHWACATRTLARS
jgi:hypothetical protein